MEILSVLNFYASAWWKEVQGHSCNQKHEGGDDDCVLQGYLTVLTRQNEVKKNRCDEVSAFNEGNEIK